MVRFFCLLLTFTLLTVKGYSQYDTIWISTPVNMISDKELITLEVEQGDTTFAFKVAEDVILDNGRWQNFVVAKKGAQVVGVVDESSLPVKGMRRPLPDEKYLPGWYYRWGHSEYNNGGRLVVRLTSILAVDGSYIPLDDCTMTQLGGVYVSEKKFKAFAVIPKESRRNCFTHPSKSFLLVKKQN